MPGENTLAAAHSPSQLRTRATLTAVLVLHVCLSGIGITWGLPSRAIDRYLFGDAPAWSGESIYRLAGGAEKFVPGRGADVDVDPLRRADDGPILLTGTEADVARIYLRYRLYTHQPDEMITMMALAGMRPGRLELDPRLYQYGGLFVYPVGALIGLGGVLGVIDVRRDVTYYLDQPDEFGKFYVAARAYAAAWGLLGVLIVFAIGRRLGGDRAGVWAALLFVLLPVVVCMAHEGKPHLPGAVLMLLAVWWGMKSLPTAGSMTGDETDPTGRMVSISPDAARRTARAWWAMCACCGAAVGMVLSSWPIFVLIPLVAWLRCSGGPSPSPHRGEPPAPAGASFPNAVSRMGAPANARSAAAQQTAMNARVMWLGNVLAGTVVGVGVYLITNPYILINALTRPEVLRSNFGNSLAMYSVSRVGEGLLRVVELTVEGATLPIVLLGATSAVAGIMRRSRTALVLVVPAVVFFAQFVLIGAGKPGEYGRFGVFADAALAIGAACAIAPRPEAARRAVRWAATVLVVFWAGACSGGYLWNFLADAGTNNSRLHLAEAARRWLDDGAQRGERASFIVAADPAPYSFPPINFARADVFLEPPIGRPSAGAIGPQGVRIRPVDKPARRTWQPEAASAPSDSSPQTQRGRGGWWPSECLTITPISWANKPFLQDGEHASHGVPDDDRGD